MRCEEYGNKILTGLVELYRKSSKDTGTNKISTRTRLSPAKIYRRYNANDGDFTEITRLNEAADELEKLGFVSLERESFGTQIRWIYAVDEQIPSAEAFLAEHFGYVSKDRKLNKVKELFELYGNAAPICAKICEKLSADYAARRVPKNLDVLDDQLRAMAFIENNREELYIREASLEIYGDSKYFEEVTLHPVCALLRRYTEKPLRQGEMEDEILEDYHILKEPQKLCIKGDAVICTEKAQMDIRALPGGVEFSAADLENISAVKIGAPVFMTIENRTSYLRCRADNAVLFYLGGYANRHQRDFIKKIAADNPGLTFCHFGDLDAGGLMIHRNLCEITGVSFSLFNMSGQVLSDAAYAGCLHPLTQNDRCALEELKKDPIYAEAAGSMLKMNAKLEQEAVSRRLGGRLL